MIKCDIDFNLKNASIYIDDCFLETKSFSDLSFKKETNIDFKNCNDLYLLNKVSIYLKLKYNAKEVDTLFIINSKYMYELLKPDGTLIQKLTKSKKKSISNNELKLILGATLFELNTIKNVDLILKEENDKGDDEMFNNNINEDFNLEDNDSKFNLDNNSEFDLDGDFDFDLDSTINELDFNKNIDLSPLTLNINDNDIKLNDDLNQKNVENSVEIFDFENNSSQDINSIQDNNITYIEENNTTTIEENDITTIENNNVNLQEETILDENTGVSSTNNSANNININIKTATQEDLKNELLKEFKNMEKYIDEQISFLEKQSKELENENSKLKLNINDLNIDEEIIIESFNKSMEIRLRLKVIKKSCKIYNNIKSQLITELTKF